MDVLVLLIALLPIAAALAGYLLNSLQPRYVAYAAILAGICSAALGGVLLAGGGGATLEQPWISLPGTEIPFSLIATPPALLFSLTTALISVAVTIFAIRERRDDPNARTFFATIALFTGAMQLFLFANTLFVMYFAWELMGLCSYLLIAHPGTAEARAAARRAFWTTRATDFGLLLAILIMMANKPSVIALSQLRGLNTASPEVITLLSILVLAAVVGKAALLPLSFWLPDAMVAPAPVSALLHAATMVAAGPVLLYNLNDLYAVSQPAMVAATLVGSVTLILGGVMALCAREPKRILAFSTISHLGLVVLGVGVLTAEAGYYHLIAHAWFKAALFIAVGILAARLASASASHVTLESLAGSAARNIPLVAALILASVSLAGVYGFAGYFGKEGILLGLLNRAGTISGAGGSLDMLAHKFPVANAAWMVATALTVLSIGITAAYITRLTGLLIKGSRTSAAGASLSKELTPQQQGDDGWNLSSWTAAILALVGSIGLAALWPVIRSIVTLGNPDKLSQLSHAALAGVISTVFAFGGAALAWYLLIVRPEAGRRISSNDKVLAGIITFFGNGMYLREFWLSVVNGTGLFFAAFAAAFDRNAVDGLAEGSGRFGRMLAGFSAWVDNSIIDGLRWWVCEICWIFKRLHARFFQTGRIQHYMFIILVAAVALCWFIARPMAQKVAPGIINAIEEGLF